MEEKPLLFSREGDTARITLNRPEVHNALSIELSEMLIEVIQDNELPRSKLRGIKTF